MLYSAVIDENITTKSTPSSSTLMNPTINNCNYRKKKSKNTNLYFFILSTFSLGISSPSTNQSTNHHPTNQSINHSSSLNQSTTTKLNNQQPMVIIEDHLQINYHHFMK
ncbi:hypothetical protein ACTFIU_010029 [Dictyostelium citrinum]